MHFHDHLALLVRSGHQVIQIVTAEERRALEDIYAVAAGKLSRPGRVNWRVVCWDMVRGFDNAYQTEEAFARNPVEALNFIPKMPFPEEKNPEIAAPCSGRVTAIRQESGGLLWNVSIDNHVCALPFGVGTYLRVGDTVKAGQVISCMLGTDCLIVLRDPAVLFNSGEGLFVRRALRNLVEHQELSNSRILRPIILLGALPVEHPELHASIVNVDYPLPSPAELAEAVDTIRASLPEEKSVIRPEFRRQLADSMRGFTRAEADNTLAYLAVMAGGFSTDPDQEAELVNSVWDRKRSQWNAGDGPLELVDSRTIPTFDDVGGYSNVKAWIREHKVRFSPRAIEMNIRPMRGMVLGGAPGTGKSFIARIIARELEVPLVVFEVDAVFQSLVGGSEAVMRDALRRISALGPCVVFLDEADKSLAGMSNNAGGDSGVASRIFGKLLSWQAGENRHGAFFVLTLNRTADLPPEFFRKGRFDRVFWCDVPGDDERRDIWIIHLKKIGIDAAGWPTAQRSTLVELSRGWTGADIEAVCLEAQVRQFNATGGETAVPSYEQLRELAGRRRIAPGTRSTIEEMRKSFADIEVEPAGFSPAATTGSAKTHRRIAVDR